MSTFEYFITFINNNIAAQTIVAVLIAISVVSFVRYSIRLSRLPPGPWGLPIVGYIPWMGRKTFDTFANLGQRYGGVFSVNLAGQTMVVLNDWPSIKATLVDQPRIIDGRPKNHFLAQHLVGYKDIAFADGPTWLRQRKLVVKTLRSIGMGKRSMEGLIMEGVYQILEKIATFDPNNVLMESLFFTPIIKMNWNLITRHSLQKEELDDFEKDIDMIFKVTEVTNPLLMFPWLRFVPPNGFGFKQLSKSNDRVMAHFKRLIEQHLTKSSDTMDQDFIDHYLHAIKAEESKSQPASPPYDVDHLLGSMWDIFTAGVETTNSTLLWGFLYLAHHPQVQSKVQMELDSIVDRSRLPNLDDVPKLSYLGATVMEIHRCSSVIPLSLPHRLTKTSQLFGYTIPKDTICFQNTYAVHRDPQLWEEPRAFRPERFIDEKNNVTWPPYLMPFSIGPRVCIGQDLAEMVLRLFFSCLLHKFTFTVGEHLPKPSFEPEVGISLKPSPYRLNVIARNE